MAAASAEAYRRLQEQLRARAIAEVALAWQLFRGDIGTWRAFEAVAAAIVRRRRRESAGLAVARIRERAAEAGVEVPAPVLPPDPPTEQLVRSLGATGLAGTWAALARGLPLAQAREVGLARVSLAASRHVLDGGRLAMLEAAAASDGRMGWRRVTSARPCAFCAMLASRGAVYRAETVGFEAHDGCACSAEPAFRTDPPSEQERIYRELWESSTEGLSGAEARAAFRRAFEEQREEIAGRLAAAAGAEVAERAEVAAVTALSRVDEEIQKLRAAGPPPLPRPVDLDALEERWLLEGKRPRAGRGGLLTDRENEEWLLSAQSWAKRAWPETEWSFAIEGARAEVIEPLVRTLNRLMQDFPEGRRFVRFFRVVDLPNRAWAVTGGPSAESIGITFNLRWAADPVALWRSARISVRDGFHPAVPQGDLIASIMVHEYGHSLTWAWTTWAREWSAARFVPANGVGLMSEEWDDLMKRLGANPVSAYARTNEHEALAEAFVVGFYARRDGLPIRSRVVRQLMAWTDLVREGGLVPMAQVRWLSDLASSAKPRAWRELAEAYRALIDRGVVAPARVRRVRRFFAGVGIRL